MNCNKWEMVFCVKLMREFSCVFFAPLLRLHVFFLEIKNNYDIAKVIADYPARASFLGRKSFNALNGCPTCRIVGYRLENSKLWGIVKNWNFLKFRNVVSTQWYWIAKDTQRLLESRWSRRFSATLWIFGFSQFWTCTSYLRGFHALANVGIGFRHARTIGKEIPEEKA